MPGGNVCFFAIRLGLANIDHASCDGMGEAKCPRCGVEYEIYASHLDAVRFGQPELSQQPSAAISSFRG
jgi:hypothetical protein